MNGKGAQGVTRLLMVEDSPSNAQLYAAFLTQAGHRVDVVESGEQAMASLKEAPADLMILDLGLPDMDGLELLRRLGGPRQAPPTIVLTGSGSVRRAVEAMREGAIDFLVKPCAGDKLRQAVVDALARRQPSETGLPSAPAAESGRDRPKTRTKRGPSGFLGESPAMSNVFGLIEAGAASTASVFITGETGTGKELCASAIHNLSDRRNGPFIALNCGAIPRELMESEIFGHRKGAFTGAVTDREGAASQADGGTLFLDELCEMELDLQVKLLRFIQSGVYRRIGDVQERQADIRFVCATNRDPLEEVKAGRFREDLYYRLHVLPINMPPLRQRGADIALLARRFLSDFSSLERKGLVDFTPDAMARILAYSWPGNVRQLENIIRTIVVLNDGTLVDKDMLPPPLNNMTASVQSEGGEDGGAGVGMPLDDVLVRPLAELEMMAIDAAIQKYSGNVSAAARALDISTSTIYRKQQAWQKRTG